MANRRSWNSLSEAYRNRLSRSGITEAHYSSGASIKAARGHRITPERPKQAFRNPDLYSDYLRRRQAKGRDIPEGTLPTPRGGIGGGHAPSIGDEIGWPGRDTVDTITFYRSRDGAKNGVDSVMTVTRTNPDGSIHSIRTYPYNQADFYTLIDLARSRGYGADVESTTTTLIA